MSKPKPIAIAEDNTLITSLPDPEFIRELLLSTVKNAEHVTPQLQNTVAKYCDYATAPMLMISDIDLSGFKP